jgi:hypothetical protein
MRLEKESLQDPNRVRVDCTLSALVFLRSLDEMKAPPVKSQKITRPMGY